jgi:prepilin-type processing-associated H-X9-DG protein
MGVTQTQAWMPNQVNFTNLATIGSHLSPALALTFIEENQATINDGALCEDVTQARFAAPYPYWVDLPGHYHLNASGMAFADGHSQTRRWTDKSILADVPPYPYPGSTGTVAGTIPATNPDLAWLLARCTVAK